MSENKNISLDTSRGTFFYFLLCMDFSHYFRWLFANFRERFLSS